MFGLSGGKADSKVVGRADCKLIIFQFWHGGGDDDVGIGICVFV